MWADGILSDNRRGRKNRSKRGRRNEVFVVSARLKEKNAERRRRFGMVVLLLVVLAGFVWLSHVSIAALGRHLFTQNEKYVIRTWDLQSTGRLLTPAHLMEYSQLSDPANLFDVDLRAVRRRLESVPLVQSVEVSRRLPDTLVIRVDERVAVAQLGADQRTALAIDRDGYVLGPGARRPNMPIIIGLRQPGLRPGMTITEPAMQDALRVLALCDKPQMHSVVHIRHINIGDPENLAFQLSTGENIRIARAHIEPRLLELVRIIQSDRSQGRVASVINMTGESNIPPVVQY